MTADMKLAIHYATPDTMRHYECDSGIIEHDVNILRFYVSLKSLRL